VLVATKLLVVSTLALTELAVATLVADMLVFAKLVKAKFWLVVELTILVAFSELEVVEVVVELTGSIFPSRIS
jgi:hypothetical protein